MTSNDERIDETVEGEDIFINRTGIMLNPEMGAELIQGAKKTVPTSEGDGEDMRLERLEYLQEGTSIGSYPSVINGHEDDGVTEVETDGNRVDVLLDKLGERLAFERQGTRLYEAFIQKVEGAPLNEANAPEVEELRHICDEELEHFELLQKAIVKLGGDATVETPSADVVGVLSHGVLQIVSDPRTSVAQGLQAVLTAELADNEGWQMLQELSKKLGHDELSQQCTEALQQEQEHLENVRTWLTTLVLSEAGGEKGLTEVRDESEDAKKEEKKSSRVTSRKKPAGKKRKK